MNESFVGHACGSECLCGRAAAFTQQAEQQVQVQQNQLRSSLNSEKFKWNNMEYYGPGGRPDDEN